MADFHIVKVDEGGANARILSRETKTDFRRVEAASLKIPARFSSAEGKRYFVRLFNTQQLNAHFISVIARTRMRAGEVEQAEAEIRSQIEAAADWLDRSIDGAESLFKAHGITCAATYDTIPLDVEAGVLSSSGRRFLEVLSKLDQLMPLLQTLEIHEVLSARQVDIERALVKRQVRNVALGTRRLATALRKRMDVHGVPGEGARRPSERMTQLPAEMDAAVGAVLPPVADAAAHGGGDGFDGRPECDEAEGVVASGPETLESREEPADPGPHLSVA